jgi:hypothetical protein
VGVAGTGMHFLHGAHNFVSCTGCQTLDDCFALRYLENILPQHGMTFLGFRSQFQLYHVYRMRTQKNHQTQSGYRLLCWFKCSGTWRTEFVFLPLGEGAELVKRIRKGVWKNTICNSLDPRYEMG